MLTRTGAARPQFTIEELREKMAYKYNIRNLRCGAFGRCELLAAGAAEATVRRMPHLAAAGRAVVPPRASDRHVLTCPRLALRSLQRYCPRRPRCASPSPARAQPHARLLPGAPLRREPCGPCTLTRVCGLRRVRYALAPRGAASAPAAGG